MGDIKIHIIYLLVLLTFFSACSIKEEVPGEPVTIGETKVRFELFTKAGTYGLRVLVPERMKVLWINNHGYLFF